MSELTIRKCTLDDVNIVGAFYDEVVKYLDDTNTNYPKSVSYTHLTLPTIA